MTSLLKPLLGIEPLKVTAHIQEVQLHLRINGVRTLRPAPHGGKHRAGVQMQHETYPSDPDPKMNLLSRIPLWLIILTLIIYTCIVVWAVLAVYKRFNKCRFKSMLGRFRWPTRVYRLRESIEKGRMAMRTNDHGHAECLQKDATWHAQGAISLSLHA